MPTSIEFISFFKNNIPYFKSNEIGYIFGTFGIKIGT